MEGKFGKIFSVVVMSTAFRWTEETEPLQKPDFTADIPQWQELIRILNLI